MGFSRTVVISCAGMGNRLGLSTTKALVDVDGKPLIIRHLEMLDAEDDVRIVVGYQAERVIAEVKKYRTDVTFVFNHNFKKTETGDSVVLAAHHANQYILSLDGDLLVHPEDMRAILNCHQEFVGGCVMETDDPWTLKTFQKDGIEYVGSFSKCQGNYEWNGVVQIESKKIQEGNGHVFQLIEPYLPLPFMKTRTKEIDTIHDYERAVSWVKNHFC